MFLTMADKSPSRQPLDLVQESVQYSDHSYWVVCLWEPFIRIRELNSANGVCPVPTVLEKTPRHVLSVAPVEAGLLSCSGEPIHGVSVPEPKPC